MTRLRRRPARPLRRSQLVRAVAVTGTLALLAFAVGVWTLVATVLDSNRKVDQLYASAQANRAKLVAEGLQPVGPPPEQIVGHAGPAGADGAPGPTGPAGPAGRDGRDASPAQVAAAVAAYLRAHPVKPGAAGPAGRDGRDGRDGVSPACLAEPDECRGLAGPAGPAGADGPRGEPPSAWRWTDPATRQAYECARDPNTGDSAPVYACTAVH